MQHQSSALQSEREQQVTEKLNKILAHVATMKEQREKELANERLKEQTTKYERMLPLIDDPLKNGGGSPRAYHSTLVDRNDSKRRFGRPSDDYGTTMTTTNRVAMGNGGIKGGEATEERRSSRRAPKPVEPTSLPIGGESSYMGYTYGAVGGGDGRRVGAEQRIMGRSEDGSVPIPSAPTSPRGASKSARASAAFSMGSPRNGFISKTTFSTAFDHCYQQTENEIVNGPTVSPRQLLQRKMMDSRLPAAQSEIKNHQHPYKDLIGHAAVVSQQQEEELERLRNSVINQLRQYRSDDEVEKRSESHRNYEYAQGVQVSLSLDSEKIIRRKRGIRVYHESDGDVSPVGGLQFQTARSPKEGLITRRKHIPNNDSLTPQLTKKRNQIEDTSIFATKNKHLRAGLSSIETKDTTPRGKRRV